MILSPIRERLENGRGAKVSDGHEATYLDVWVKKVSNEFTDRGNISDMARTFTG